MFSQGPDFIHYTVADGLPGNEVYTAVSDSLGNIYFGTSRGAVKFNGKDFVPVKNATGRNLSSVLRLVKDSRQQIWAFLFDGRIEYLDGDVFRSLQLEKDPNYRDVVRTGTILESMRRESNGVLTFGFREKGIITSDASLMRSYSRLPFGIYVDISDHAPLWFSVFNSCLIDRSDSASIWLKSKDCWNRVAQLRYVNNIRLSFADGPNGCLELGTSVGAYEIDRKTGKLHDCVPGDVRFLYKDRKQRLWIGFGPGDLRVTAPGGDLSTLQEFPAPEGVAVIGVLDDAEGGIWLITENDGIFYTPNLDVQFYSYEKLGFGRHVPVMLATDAAGNMISVGRGLVLVWKEGKIISRETLDDSLFVPEVPLRLEAWGDRQYAVLSGHRIHICSGGTRRSWELGFSLVMTRLKEKYIYVGARMQRMTILDLETFDTTRVFRTEEMRQEALLVVDTADRYIGSLDGLYRLLGDSLIYMGDLAPALGNRITSLALWGDSTIVVGTSGAGVVLLRDSLTFTLNSHSGLPEDWVRQVVTTPEKIWIAGNHGIHSLGGPPGHLQIRNYSAPHGIPGSEFSDIAICDGYVYATDKKGLYVFREDDLPLNYKTPRLLFTDAVVNSTRIPVAQKRKLVLDHDENNIRLEFENKSFRLKGFTYYRYRIPEFSDTYFYTSESYIMLTGLKPGTYHVQLEARNEDGIWPAVPEEFELVIRPHWTGTWLFRTFVWVFAVVVFVAGLIVYLRRIQKRNEEKLVLLESRQIALARLMNPHFVFNVMYSLQGFVLGEEKRKAAVLISDFSRVMRLSIDNTRQKYVDLGKETELLMKYVQIEQMQYAERFVFTLEIGQDVREAGLMIPPMVLQPFVENSIRHGLLPLKNKMGELSVLLFREKGILLCRIEDNGVGLKTMPNTGHRSSGMEITQNRLKLLHKENHTPYIFRMGSIEAPGKTGTYVEFSLPYLDRKKP